MFMKIINKIRIFGVAAAASMLLFTSCNKVDTMPTPNPIDTTTTGKTLSATLTASADDSLFNRLVIRSGLQPTLNIRTNRYTLIVPNNAAMRQFVAFVSGGLIPAAAPDATHSKFLDSTLVVAPGVIKGLPLSSVGAIVSYNILPQIVRSSSFTTAFPNFQYPSLLSPAPGTLARLDVYLSKRNGNYVNNVPFGSVDVEAANGIMHRTLALNAPPQRAMWERINTDADLTIFKAGVIRADSGVAPTSTSSLIWALSNFGPNLTVFAPNNAAMKAAINFLSGGLVPIGAPDATFIGFLGSNNVTTQLVKGLVVYHILGSRAFSVNFPTTATSYPTLLNGAIPTHPGVSLTATFTGPVVTAATVKGVINPTASNILINSIPDTAASYKTTPPLLPLVYVGSSDQHYINGTMHKINQVLLPQ